jgi:hypothetical protein
MVGQASVLEARECFFCQMQEVQRNVMFAAFALDATEAVEFMMKLILRRRGRRAPVPMPVLGVPVKRTRRTGGWRDASLPCGIISVPL